MPATLTNYSATFGGAKGYLNIGGWNSTITDVATTAKETVGIVRTEGANKYMYVQIGTAGAAPGAFLQFSTGYADVNGLVSPMAMTAGGTATTGTVAYGMAIATAPTGVCYAWVLVEGIATGYAHANQGLTLGSKVCPSTNTANCLEQNAGAATAIGVVVGPSVGTAAAQAGSTGNLIYFKFN